MTAPRTPEERAAQIKAIAATRPPFTAAQRARLRPLLAGGIPLDPARMTRAQAAPHAA